jgi:hypothetical protein
MATEAGRSQGRTAPPRRDPWPVCCHGLNPDTGPTVVREGPRSGGARCSSITSRWCSARGRGWSLGSSRWRRLWMAGPGRVPERRGPQGPAGPRWKAAHRQAGKCRLRRESGARGGRGRGPRIGESATGWSGRRDCVPGSSHRFRAAWPFACPGANHLQTNHADFGGTGRTSAARSPDRTVRNGSRRTGRHEPTGLITLLD